MRLGPGLLYEGRTLQGARPKLADFCSATMAEFYSAVDNTAAFDAVRNRDDFAKIAEKRVGKYPVFVGEGAAKATQRGTTVSAEAKAFVTNWLQEAYGVSLK